MPISSGATAKQRNKTPHLMHSSFLCGTFDTIHILYGLVIRSSDEYVKD